MKNFTYNTPYCKLYGNILQETMSITFEQFLVLHALKKIDSMKTQFVASGTDDDFGHFEIELDTPKYRYDVFFNESYAK